MIINGITIKDKILADVRASVEALPFAPVFCDIIVGDDKVSMQYVRMKARIAQSVGITFREASYPVDTTTDTLIEEIERLNTVPHMCGIIVQLPLPSHIDKTRVLDAIAPGLDVDCLGAQASALFYENKSSTGYPTALACMAILDSIDVDLSEKKIVVLGQGMLVGKPVSHLLRTRGFSVDTITRSTENTSELIADADVIISAIGQGKYLTGSMIKQGVIIIDAGTSEENGAIVGDVDLDSVAPITSYVSSTPGGVGPVTVAMLLSNVVAVAKIKYE